jgi:hypothetical protein
MARIWTMPSVLLLAAVLISPTGCGGVGGSPTPPNPIPLPSPTPPTVTEVAGATRGASDGPTSMFLVAADPLPGATLTGCGGGAAGCGGRIRMTLRVQAQVGGPALGLLAFLHSDRMTACFRGALPPFVLDPGRAQNVEVVFDPADTDEACPTPLDLTHLAVVVEGTVDVSARQEWALRYRLER